MSDTMDQYRIYATTEKPERQLRLTIIEADNGYILVSGDERYFVEPEIEAVIEAVKEFFVSEVTPENNDGKESAAHDRSHQAMAADNARKMP